MTEVRGEDAARVTYGAMTPGFSVFAVAARAPSSMLGKVVSILALVVILIGVLAVLRKRRGRGML
jgi:hypothetical protein